ncbi:MAG: hypothetical protein AB1744_05115 [Candidatus Zixiibacteriota bacterium]
MLKSGHSLLLPALAIALICAGQVSASRTGTIVLKTGETYENVQFEIDRSARQITIDNSWMKVVVTFDLVRHVFDEDGQEITGPLLDPGYGRPGPTERLWDIGLRLAGNYSVPSGRYYKYVGEGVGYEGDLLVSLSRRISLRLGLSRSGMEYLVTREDIRLDSTERGTVELDLSALRIFLAGQVDLRADRPSHSRTFYYIWGGVGLITHRTEATAILVDSVTDEILVLSGSTQHTRFLNCLGLSVVHMLSDKVGLDVGLGLDVVYGSRVPDSKWYELFINTVYSFVFDVKIGIIALM